MPDEEKPRRRAWRRRQVRRRRFVVGAGVCVLVLVLAGAILAYQGMRARTSLVRAEGQARQLEQQIGRNDAPAANITLAKLQKSTHDATSHTRGILWKIGGHAPLIGRNLAAVRTVSSALDEIVTEGLDPLVRISGKLGPRAFTLKNGKIDLTVIRSISPALADADTALRIGNKQLDDVDPDTLLGPLKGPVKDLKDKVSRAQSTTAAGLRATQLLPSMLGGSGKRSYILAFQNNAETRATGGLPGAYAVLAADDGKLRLASQGAAVDFDFFDPPVVKLTAEERGLYSNLLAGFWGDSNFTPDFPRTAQIMQAMLKKKFDKTVDGTISIDPVALSYILKGTGPVRLADGTELSSSNAVQLLLHKVYLDYADSPAKQDAFFASAAKRVFDAVTSGRGDPAAVIRELTKAVGENRILVASSHRGEQRILATSQIGGRLSGNDGATPHVGLYINDSTSAKLEYYLARKTTVSAQKCSAVGVQTLNTTTVLSSHAPKNAASLPDSILGNGTGEKPGSMRMNLRFYTPYDGQMTSLALNGRPQTINFGSQLGRQVVIVSVLLAPGETVTVTTTILTGSGQRNGAVFSTTPGIEATPNNVRVPTSCG